MPIMDGWQVHSQPLPTGSPEVPYHIILHGIWVIGCRLCLATVGMFVECPCCLETGIGLMIGSGGLIKYANTILPLLDLP